MPGWVKVNHKAKAKPGDGALGGDFLILLLCVVIKSFLGAAQSPSGFRAATTTVLAEMRENYLQICYERSETVFLCSVAGGGR